MSLLTNPLRSIRINAKKHLRDARDRKVITGLFALFGILIVGLGVASLFYTQQAIQERQELRRQAAQEDKQIVITTEATPAVSAGETATVTLKINTNQIQTDGVQTNFTITSDEVTISDVEINPLIDNLDKIIARTQDVDNGVQIMYTGFAPLDGGAFSSDTNIAFLDVTFTPDTQGSITISFDNDTTKSTISGSGEDALSTIQDLTFISVQDDGETQTSCVVGGCSGTLCLPADEAGNIATNCRYRDEYVCYDGLTCEVQADGSCGFTEQEDLQQCLDEYNDEEDGGDDEEDGGDDENENGGDDEENGGDDENTDDEQNQDNKENNDDDDDDDAVGGIEVKSCDEGCDSNAECDVNLRCYEGACRLAINPTSPSCDPNDTSGVDTSTETDNGDQQVVINRYYTTTQSTTTDTANNKGASNPSIVVTPTPSATTSATPSADTTPDDTMSGSTDDQIPTTRDEDEPETMLDVLVGTELFGVSLPLALMGLGIGIVAIGGLYYATTALSGATATAATTGNTSATGTSSKSTATATPPQSPQSNSTTPPPPTTGANPTQKAQSESSDRREELLSKIRDNRNNN